MTPHKHKGQIALSLPVLALALCHVKHRIAQSGIPWRLST